MRTVLNIVVGMLLVGVMAGCLSTPDSRIKNESALFATFPAEVQVKVRKGEVDVGFTRDMVRLALGLPNRVHARKTEAGQTEIWVYTGTRSISRVEPMDNGYWYRDRSGRMRRSYDTVWMDRGYQEEYPVLRLEFSGNTVKAIERMQR